jgi:hypothetical protein
MPESLMAVQILFQSGPLRLLHASQQRTRRPRLLAIPDSRLVITAGCCNRRSLP